MWVTEVILEEGRSFMGPMAFGVDKDEAEKYLDSIEMGGFKVVGSANRCGSVSWHTAKEAMRHGLVAAREGWNGKGMFAFIRPGDEFYGVELKRFASLPEAVKNYFGNEAVVPFSEYFCLKDAGGVIRNGWHPSNTDLLANDWVVAMEVESLFPFVKQGEYLNGHEEVAQGV